MSLFGNYPTEVGDLRKRFRMLTAATSLLMIVAAVPARAIAAAPSPIAPVASATSSITSATAPATTPSAPAATATTPSPPAATVPNAVTAPPAAPTTPANPPAAPVANAVKAATNTVTAAAPTAPAAPVTNTVKTATAPATSPKPAAPTAPITNTVKTATNTVKTNTTAVKAATSIVPAATAAPTTNVRQGLVGTVTGSVSGSVAKPATALSHVVPAVATTTTSATHALAIAPVTSYVASALNPGSQTAARITGLVTGTRTTGSTPRASSPAPTQPSGPATQRQPAAATARAAATAPPAANASRASSPSDSPRTGLTAGAAVPPEQAAPVNTRQTSARSFSRTHPGWPHVRPTGSPRRVWTGAGAGLRGDSPPSPQETSTGSFDRAAVGHRAPSVGPQPDPIGAPAPVPDASTEGGTAGGLGAFFFFGLAALLASAGLVRPRVLSVLRRTAKPAAPQPFLSLLERPG